MPSLKTLTEAKIKKTCGDVIFERALDYVCTGFLSNRLLYSRADKLTGVVEGNFGNYRTTFQLLSDGDLRISCTCPAEICFCKHAAALGITYLREPETFFDMNTLPELLEKKSKTELQKMVIQMIVKHTDCLSVLGVAGFEERGADYEDEY